MTSEQLTSSIPQIEGRNPKYTPQLLLMWTPNILHPKKLAANLRHPVHEVLHTTHMQYPVDMQESVEYHVVEHRLFRKLVTVDVIRHDEFAQGLVPRIRQLFDRNFYFGHASFFPQPFKLIDRTFVKNGFNQEEHVRKILDDTVNNV